MSFNLPVNKTFEDTRQSIEAFTPEQLEKLESLITLKLNEHLEAKQKALFDTKIISESIPASNNSELVRSDIPFSYLLPRLPPSTKFVSDN